MTKSSDIATVDDVASFWNGRPCNIRHSTKEIGTREYFDEVEERKYFVEPHIPGFAQFSRWSGKRVLEVGCGMGTDAINFARAGADYWGIDLSEASIALARKRFEAFGLKANLQPCNAEKLSEALPAEHFDLVYSFGVIHHTPHPDAVIREIRKVIKPDGEFRLMLYAKNSWKNVMIEGGFDQPEAQTGCPIAFTYTQDEVRDLLGQGGFEAVDITQDHIFPYLVEKYVQYEYEPQPWFKAMPQAIFQHLEKSLGWHMLIVAKPI
jgi:ubiquinone/menaquinone biosynthesis C-methylase UbiE